MTCLLSSRSDVDEAGSVAGPGVQRLVVVLGGVHGGYVSNARGHHRGTSRELVARTAPLTPPNENRKEAA